MNTNCTLHVKNLMLMRSQTKLAKCRCHWANDVNLKGAGVKRCQWTIKEQSIIGKGGFIALFTRTNPVKGSLLIG